MTKTATWPTLLIFELVKTCSLLVFLFNLKVSATSILHCLKYNLTDIVLRGLAGRRGEPWSFMSDAFQPTELLVMISIMASCYQRLGSLSGGSLQKSGIINCCGQRFGLSTSWASDVASRWQIRSWEAGSRSWFQNGILRWYCHHRVRTSLSSPDTFQESWYYALFALPVVKQTRICGYRPLAGHISVCLVLLV